MPPTPPRHHPPMPPTTPVINATSMAPDAVNKAANRANSPPPQPSSAMPRHRLPMTPTASRCNPTSPAPDEPNGATSPARSTRRVVGGRGSEQLRGGEGVQGSGEDVQGTTRSFQSLLRKIWLLWSNLLQTITLRWQVGSSNYFLNPKFHILYLDNNDRIYILDLKKRRWIVKGRYRDALEFQDSVLHLWDHTNYGPTLTIFLVN